MRTGLFQSTNSLEAEKTVKKLQQRLEYGGETIYLDEQGYSLSR